MTIVASELIFRKPKEVSDAASNGGRMGFSQYASATAANVFGHAFAAERASGSQKYRKICCCVANDSDETLYGSLLRLFMPTRGDDWISYHMGTARDTQADITGIETRYGVATLNAAVVAGGSTLVVKVENADLASGADAIARAGDVLFISDKESWNASSGNVEQHIINTVSASGSQLTITLDGTTLANGYAAWNGTTRTGGHIMTAPAAVDLACSLTNSSQTVAGSGVVDFDQITLDAIGTAELTLTGTFTDATHYTLTCDDAGHSLGSGTTGADYSPSNPAVSKPYLTIPAAAFSGTFAAGDTFTFQSHPPARYVWLRRDIPAACGSLSGNQFVLVHHGESAST